MECIFESSRKGDVKHSLASLEKIKKKLAYHPEYTLEKGLQEMIEKILVRT
jgi:nucleoside-diphosphate-sugar epimerase